MRAVLGLLMLYSATLLAAQVPLTPPGPGASPESGFSVQTGYEGYLVPSEESSEPTPVRSGLSSLAASLFAGSDTLATLLGGQHGATAVEGEDRHGAPSSDEQKIKLIGTHGKPVLLSLPFSKHSKIPKFDKFHKLSQKTPKIWLIKLVTKLFLTFAGLFILFLVTGGIAASVCAFTPLCSITFLARENVRSLMSNGKLTQFTSFVMDAIDKYQEMQRTSPDLS